MPISPLSIVAFALALAPAIYAWWTGRTVLAHADDPALPELLFERRRRLFGWTFGGGMLLAVLFANQALWTLPLLWLAVLLSSYPLRRALFGERQSPLGYLRYTIFSAIGQIGIWMLAACAPAIVASLAFNLASGDSAAMLRIAIAGGVTTALILAVWQHYYTRVFLDLHRGSPLRTVARPELMARLDAILDRVAPSLARRPEIYRYGAPGAYVMNAFAIPSRWHPAVALGDTLLATMSDDEVVAVFAHEVAHHEQFNASRWRRARWASLVLIVLVGVLPALLVRFSPLAALTMSWSMPVLIALTLGKRASTRRDVETKSDVRAVALAGDVEALVSALTKLHIYSRVPRRWPHAIERAATHPSLARRIQALREANEAISKPEAQVAAPLTAIRALMGGVVVAFDRDRAYWFDGVPVETPLDLHALRDAASSYRAIAYGDLTELRVGVGDGARSVEATDHDGRSWRVPIAPNDVSTVQAALDRVDVKLGRRRPTLAPASATGVRWLTLALLVMLMGAGELGVALIPILFVLFRPTVIAAVAATAAITVGRILLAVRLIGWADTVRQIALLLSLSLAVVLIVQTVRRVRVETARGNVRRLTREAWWVAGVLGGVALLVAASLWEIVADRPASLVAHPLAIGVATALFGAGSALLTIPNRWWRAGGALFSSVAMGGGVLLSGDGWLFHRTAALQWSAPRLTATGVARVPGGGLSLTASPNGAAFAVSQYHAPRRGEPAAPRYLVGRFADGPRALRPSTAAKIVFLDDETLLALDNTSTDSLEIRAERVAAGIDGSVTVLWRRHIPGLEDPQLLLDRVRNAWLVVGRGDGDWRFVVMTDTLGGRSPRVHRISGGSTGDVGEIMTQPLAAFADGGAIWSTLPHFRGAAGTLAPLWLALAESARWEIRGTDATGERFLADVEGFPVCAAELDALGTVCVERSPNASHVWRAPSARTMVRVADLPPALDLVHAEASDRVAAAERFGQRIVVLDVETRQALRLTLPGSAAARGTRWTADLAARGGYVLVLSAGRDGTTVTRYAIR